MPVVHETRSKVWRSFDVLPKLCSTFPAELEESFNLVSLVSGIGPVLRSRKEARTAAFLLGLTCAIRNYGTEISKASESA